MFNTEIIKNYKVIDVRKLSEMNGQGYLLQHVKTGARVLLVDNDDENKVFCIGFRTPPANSRMSPTLAGSVRKRLLKRSFREIAPL